MKLFYLLPSNINSLFEDYLLDSSMEGIFLKKSMMRNFLTLILLCTSTTLFAQEWLPFADLKAGISLKYPPDWENRTDESGRIFLTSPREGEKDAFRENLNIGYKSDEAYTSMLILEPAFKALPGQLQKSFIDFKVEKEGYRKMNGLDIYEIIYTGKMKDQETQNLRFIQWFCVHDSKLYTITYAADAMNKTFINMAQNIMRGITFKQ